MPAPASGDGPRILGNSPGAFVLVVLATASCGGGEPLAGPVPGIEVTADLAEVEFGRAFGVTVRRAWTADAPAAPWDDRALAPLEVRETGAVRREDAGRVEEIRTFAARAWTHGTVTVRARLDASRASAADAAGADGAAGATDPPIATGAPLAVRVKPSVDPARPGPPELPGAPLPEPLRWLRWASATALLALATAAALLVARRRRPPEPVPEEETPAPAAAAPAGPPPHEVALARLGALRGGAANAAFHVEVADALRGYVAARFAIPAEERTTEELVAAADTVRAIDAERRALLASVLRDADLVKFASAPSTAEGRARALGDAERFVRETAPTSQSALPAQEPAA